MYMFVSCEQSYISVYFHILLYMLKLHIVAFEQRVIYHYIYVTLLSLVCDAFVRVT